MTTMKRTMLTRSTKQTIHPPVTDELLETIVQRITEAGSPLKIILFGSRARGNARPDSDLDILVIEAPGADCKQLYLTYFASVRELFPALDIRVNSIRDVAAWRNVPNHYLTEATRNGRVLFANSEHMASYFVGDSASLMVCEEVEPKTPCDYSRRWFELADGDIDVCKILLDARRFRHVCLFTQQAIEKYLKGLLEFQGLTTDKTHDLELLDKQCKQLVQLPDIPKPLLEAISKYAIEARYDADFAPTLESASEALAIAEQIRENVLAFVPPEARLK